jgi:hypothetical protein
MTKCNRIIKLLRNGLFSLTCLFISILICSYHPYYVSVTDISYKKDEKTLQVSCKMFTDNIESTLKKVYKTPVDLLHPKDEIAAKKLLAHYIITHLKIKANGKPAVLDFLGYEQEEDAIWSYFEIRNMDVLPKNIHIENSLLYEYFPQQINMVHTQVEGKKQSSKVINPDKEMEFIY